MILTKLSPLSGGSFFFCWMDSPPTSLHQNVIGGRSPLKNSADYPAPPPSSQDIAIKVPPETLFLARKLPAQNFDPVGALKGKPPLSQAVPPFFPLLFPR